MNNKNIIGEQFSLKKKLKIILSRQRNYALLIMFPFSVYVVYFGGQVPLRDLWGIVAAPAVAAVVSQVFHRIFSLRKATSIDALAQDLVKNAKQVKIALINYPRFESVMSALSWVITGITSYLFIVLFIDTTVLITIAIAVVTSTALLFSTVLNFFVTERYTLQLLQHPEITKIKLKTSDVKIVPDRVRKLFLLFSVAIFPLVILGFFSLLSANFKVHFDNLAFHFSMIILFMIVALSLLTYEGYQNYKLSIRLMKKNIANLTDGEISGKDITMVTGSEIGFIAQNLDIFQKNLYKTLSTLMQTTTSVNQSSEQVAQSTFTISTSAKQQLENIKEISTSLEEITSTVKRTAVQSQKTLQMAQATSQSSQKGTTLLKEIIQEIHSINDNIALVEATAGQTNLLALNASIEAARSNERGKGFAVVASEINKLAENSSLSSKEIIALVKNALQKSEHAGEIFSTLTPKMQESSELFQDIVSASQQQEQGIEQIIGGISQLREIAESNANASEELTKIATDMKSFSEKLADEVSFFKLID